MIQKLRANFPKYFQHLSFYLSSIWDKFSYKFGGAKSKIEREAGLNTILFVTEDPRIDIIRFFEAIKTVHVANYILLINHSKLDGLFLNAGFNAVHFFRNHWDFRKKLNDLPPISLIHGFTRRCFVIEILLKEQSIPIVISAKDTSVCSHGLNPPHWYLKEEIPVEKYVFQNVDGLIAESLEPCHAFRLFDLKKTNKRMYFPNYFEGSKSSTSDHKISQYEMHLVYAGSIRGSQDDPAEHGNIQMHWLIHALNEQKIHFHVYPNPNMSRAVYDEYFELDRNLPFFHMHESLEPEVLAEEISQYHFGLIPFFNEDTKRSPMKRYYSTSLKIFNYIEAGLPVLISNDMGHQRWLLERYGLAVGLDKSDFFHLNELFEQLDYKSIRQNLLEKRKGLTLENQIHRVVEFYKDIIREHDK